MRVPSPKTERHEGRESRLIPLFPELRPHLEAAFDEAEPGSEYIITKYRTCNANLGGWMKRVIRRAGLKPWPKLFQNLRSTRETELAEQFPIHVVCDWIGNTAAVAAKHYLQVTDQHFELATSKATQNPTQYAAVSVGIGEQSGGVNAPIAERYAALPTHASESSGSTRLQKSD
jgi:hypothetical protein